MKLWNNPEIKHFLLLYGAFSCLFLTAGFLIHPYAGGLLGIACIFFLMLFLLYTGKRYRVLSEMSLSIDKLLHGEPIRISACREGELSILEAELQKMTTRLQEQADALQQDKLCLSSAMADISHQLRTPLTSINLTLSMLRSSDLPAGRRQELLRDLSKSLQKIDWLIEALLKLSKLDAGTVQFAQVPVSVAALIDKACENLLVPMELRGQELTVLVQKEAFVGDLSWTGEALTNLVKNCHEHTPEGGCIRIEALETPLFTQITVRDNGPGFVPEEIPRLFERFYKGSGSSPESVGIGLALARQIITSQNGTLTAANAPEGGALFTIRFYKSVV